MHHKKNKQNRTFFKWHRMEFLIHIHLHSIPEFYLIMTCATANHRDRSRKKGMEKMSFYFIYL